VDSGTILETHGIRTLVERYCALGPLGRLGKGREYPRAMRPTENIPRYVDGDKPSEEAFDLTTPVGVPRPTRLPPTDPANQPYLNR